MTAPATTPPPLYADTALHPKQQEFAEAALSGRYNYLLYGGGIRSGKTFGAALLLMVLCRVFPGSRWAVVRQDLPTLRRTFLPTYGKVRELVGRFAPAFKKDNWTATMANGSQIILFPESLDTDPELERWKGLEVNGFLLEEAPELSERAWWKSVERAGSWVIPGAPVQPHPLVLLTCNPSPGWVKERFYDLWAAGELEAPYHFVPGTVDDNPSVALGPDGERSMYRQSLDNLPKRERDRFVGGDWSGLGADTLLFPELRADVHRVPAAPPDPEDRLVVAADWGWSAPAPALWISTTSGYGTDGVAFSRVVAEWWPTQTKPADWARGVLQRSAIYDAQGLFLGYSIAEVILDSAAWAPGVSQTGESSPAPVEGMAPIFREAGVRLVKAVKGPQSLAHSTSLLHDYFHSGNDGERFAPLLVVGSNCSILWSEITSIQRGQPDKHRREDPEVEAPHQFNHGTAALRYFCASRPKPADLTAFQRRALDPIYQRFKYDPRSQEAAYAEQARRLGKPLMTVKDLVRRNKIKRRHPQTR